MLPVPAVSAAPTVRETDGEIILSGESFTAVFAKSDGMLKDYASGGVQKVLGSRISVDRPFSGLDCKPGWGWRSAMDEARATAFHFGEPETFTGRNCIVIKTAFGGKLLHGEIGWTVYGDGSVLCSLDGQTGEGLKLPRLGVELQCPATWVRFPIPASDQSKIIPTVCWPRVSANTPRTWMSSDTITRRPPKTEDAKARLPFS